MEKNLKKIKAAYDTLSKEYARHFSGEHDTKPMDRELLERFMKEVGARKPVWDLGCGTGETARCLNSLGLEVSGLDLSEEMLVQARKLNPGLLFQQGDMLNLPCPDASVAAIVSFYAVVHMPRHQVTTAVKEMFRLLKPGGLLLFTFHVGEETMHLDEFLGHEIDVDFYFFPISFFCESLETAGFRNVEIIERAPYPDIEFQSRRAYIFASKPR